MIAVTVYKTGNGAYAGIDVSGHAGYGESGEDIVCAAVSALVITAVNSIERFTEDETACRQDEAKGVSFRFKKTPSHDAELLMNSLVFGLEQIESGEEYSDYMDIIFEEV